MSILKKGVFKGSEKNHTEFAQVNSFQLKPFPLLKP